MVKWVEKSSIEKIHRLLEISEGERHYQVLLTRANISAVRHNPAPYTLLVIPRPLPSNVVEGEHFVLADVRRLASDSASSSRDPMVEASSHRRPEVHQGCLLPQAENLAHLLLPLVGEP